jgi:hypothetical protein
MMGRHRNAAAAIFVVFGLATIALAQQTPERAPDPAALNSSVAPPIVERLPPVPMAPMASFALKGRGFDDTVVTPPPREQMTYDPFGWGSRYGLEALTVNPPPEPETPPIQATNQGQRGTFLFRADALWLKREKTNPAIPIVLNNPSPFDPTTGSIVADSQVSIPIQAGYRFVAGYEFPDASLIEFNYFAVQSWQGSQTATGDNSLFLAGNPPNALTVASDLSLASNDYNAAEIMTVINTTSIKNYELNLVRPFVYRRFALLAGARYIELNDNIDIRSTNLDTSSTSDYLVSAMNRLTGGQLGLQYNREIAFATFQAFGKAGVFSNSTQTSQIVGDFNNTPPPLRAGPDGVSPVTATRHVSSFVGEVGLNGTFHIREWCNVRIGYNVFWLQQLALAPYQLDFSLDPTAGTSVNHTSNLLLHGFNTGLEMRF